MWPVRRGAVRGLPADEGVAGTAQLIFFDDIHQYQVDGEIYPSVSEILRFLSREIYGTVAQFQLDHAADRGTRVHKAAEVLDKYRTVECDDDVAPYLRAYVRFLREHVVQWDGIERAMFHRAKKYAGTLDRCGTVDGRLSIIDIKSSYTVHKPLVKAQLNAYADLYENAEGGRVEALYVLHLRPDASYRLTEIDRDSTEFDACYALHKALEKKRRVKKNA